MSQNIDFSALENISFNGSTVETMVVDGETIWTKMASGDIYYVGQVVTINGATETVVSIDGTSITGTTTTVDTSNPGGSTITTGNTTNQTGYSIGQTLWVDGVAKTIAGISGTVITFTDGSTLDTSNTLGAVVTTTDPNANTTSYTVGQTLYIDGSAKVISSISGSVITFSDGSTLDADNPGGTVISTTAPTTSGGTNQTTTQTSGVGETMYVDGEQKNISTINGTVYTFDDGTQFDTNNPGSSIYFPYQVGDTLWSEDNGEYDQITITEIIPETDNFRLKDQYGSQSHWLPGGFMYPTGGWFTYPPLVYLPDYDWGLIHSDNGDNADVRKQSSVGSNYNTMWQSFPWYVLTDRLVGYSGQTPVQNQFASSNRVKFDRGSVLVASNRQAVGPLDGTFTPDSSALSYDDQQMRPTIDMLTTGTAIGTKHEYSAGGGLFAYQQGCSTVKESWSHGSVQGNLQFLPHPMTTENWDLINQKWVPGNSGQAGWTTFLPLPDTFPSHVQKFFKAHVVSEYIYFYDEDIGKFWGYAWITNENSEWKIYGGRYMEKGVVPSGATTAPKENPRTYADYANLETVDLFYPEHPLGPGQMTGSGPWQLTYT